MCDRYFFITVMDRLLKNAREELKYLQTTIRYTNLTSVKLNGMIYTDHIRLVAESQEKNGKTCQNKARKN